MIPLYHPWTTEFDETGGYDCMTGAWVIKDSGGKIIASVDQADYDQPHCDYEFRSPEAEAVARFIVMCSERAK